MLDFNNLYPNESERLRALDRPFHAGAFFSQGFALFQRAAGPLIGFTLLYMVIAIGVALGSGLTGSTILSSIATFLIAPLVAGLFLIAYTARNYSEPSFEAGFGFTKHYLPLLGVEAVHQVIAALLLLVMPTTDIFTNPEALEGMEPEEILAVVSDAMPVILGIAFLQFLIRTVFMFAPLYVLFYDMGIVRSLQASWNLVTRHVGGVLIFMVISIGVYIGGLLLCGIGLILAIPIVYAATYCAFEHYALFPETPDKNYLDELIS